MKTAQEDEKALYYLLPGALYYFNLDYNSVPMLYTYMRPVQVDEFDSGSSVLVQFQARMLRYRYIYMLYCNNLLIFVSDDEEQVSGTKGSKFAKQNIV